MRHLARLSLVLVPAMLAVAAPASAQFGGGGGRGGGAARAQAASAEPPRVAPTVAALVLGHAGDLALTDSQRTLIASVRHAQDSANGPWMQRLESLRNGPRPINPNDVSQEQRDQMAARRAAVIDAIAGMRETDAEARQKVMTALNPDQQQKAAVLENDAQKQARDDSERRGREAFGSGRRGAGDMDRPPED